MRPADLVRHHYRQEGLAETLLAALRAAGRDPDRLTREDLEPFEEFHIRGRAATRELASALGLRPGDEVLDVGSGIGGPARTLAAEFGCRVTGVDLVDEFCRAAAVLTARVGLADRVAFHRADAQALPFPDGRFPVVMLEHVNMNIEDKPGLFHELARVLAPGGRLGLYEICAGEVSPPHFPVPWATDPRTSFLARPAALRAAAESAGLLVRTWEDLTAISAEWFRGMLRNLRDRPAGAPPPLGIHLVMGPDAMTKADNLVRNLDQDRVRVVRATLLRQPGTAA